MKTKAQYQVSMIQWFVQRRYEHVLMAARFYNQIWKDGDAALCIDKNSDVSKLFSESVGVSPTVASLDALSNEAIREAAKYVEAFDLMLSRNELHSASQRLMEAYALGEYLAPVATLPLDKKRRVLDYVRDLHELYGTLQARDYTKTKELAGRLKQNARDFPSSKVDSAIAAYTLASDLAIEEAKAHLLAKDGTKAAEKIKAATEIWPTNPKLNEFRNLVNNSGGLVTIRNDFDRLLSEGNFREIARRQYEIAPAIQGDATREDAFKQIMGNLMKIEAALGKAAEFSKVGQDYAAWEQLAKLREQFPDDPKLGRELELLAPKVADFTKALDTARQFENRTPRQTGSALSWYLKARSIHPQSKLAEDGVKRLTNEILPPEDATTGGASEN
jgi:Flp pilus assembly protein TadD